MSTIKHVGILYLAGYKKDVDSLRADISYHSNRAIEVVDIAKGPVNYNRHMFADILDKSNIDCILIYITSNLWCQSWANELIEIAHQYGKRLIGVWASTREHPLPKGFENYGDALSVYNPPAIVKAINGKKMWNSPYNRKGVYRDIPRGVSSNE